MLGHQRLPLVTQQAQQVGLRRGCPVCRCARCLGTSLLLLHRRQQLLPLGQQRVVLSTQGCKGACCRCRALKLPLQALQLCLLFAAAPLSSSLLLSQGSPCHIRVRLCCLQGQLCCRCLLLGRCHLLPQICKWASRANMAGGVLTKHWWQSN